MGKVYETQGFYYFCSLGRLFFCQQGKRAEGVVYAHAENCTYKEIWVHTTARMM